MTSSWSSPHPRSHRNRVCALVVVFLLVKSPSISSWLKQPTNHFRRVYLSRRNEITSLARRVYFLFIVSCLSCGTIAANISQKLSFFSPVITAENISRKYPNFRITERLLSLALNIVCSSRNERNNRQKFLQTSVETPVPL